MDEPSSDYDSPWKQALDLWLDSFLALFFPEVHAAIDWSVPPEPQNSELAQFLPEDETGRLYVDHLVKGRLRSGVDCSLFLHIEIQGRDRKAFRRRMFGYRIRVHDHTGGPVESLVLLTEGGGSGHLAHHREEGILSGVAFWYPVARLAALWPRWRELERSGDPIALVVLAHLASQRSRKNPRMRYNWKVRLARRVLRAGHDEATAGHLLRFVDWLLRLPRELQDDFRLRRAVLKEEIMGRPYVTQCEELMMEEAREQGLAEGVVSTLADVLLARFGRSADTAVQAVRGVTDVGRLQRLARVAAVCADVEEFRRALDGDGVDMAGSS